MGKIYLNPISTANKKLGNGRLGKESEREIEMSERERKRDKRVRGGREGDGRE